ncbi:MAG: cytochrome c biogenesis protein CcsA [Tannerella sp.]|jgi:ABC-type transport system involved in cytochrome c biogenesis permease subunit|nr:cytochrome c biogenesis protein CcsA [Tannerella sp.]
MRKLPFILLIILTMILAIATFAERRYGTPFVTHHFYSSWWMMTLWATVFITALSSCVHILFKKRKPAFLFHCAFGIILAGALTTFTTSKRGQIHLRENGMIESTIEIPFAISLSKFEMDYYTGTKTPADYISYLSIKDDEKIFDAVVSMNNIFKYRGFRFYQASYDSDLKGTVLSVSYDPYGIAVTYAGYLLLLLSMIWLLTCKNGNFRRLIRSLGIVILVIIPGLASAQRTLTKEEAKAFGRLSMYYNGRIVPIDTYAHDFTRKITGKSSYKNFNAVQVLAGWMFFPEEWQEEPMIKIKDKEIRQFISENKNKLRLSDFFNARIYKLSYTNFPAQHKGIREADEKISLLMAQRTGSTLTAFPQGNHWYACTDDLSEVRSDDTLFISKAFLMMHETLKQENHEAIIHLFEKMSVYQYKRTEEGAISPTKTKLEIFYNKFDAASILFKINIGVGILTFAGFIWGFLTGRKKRIFKSLAYIQIIHSMAFLSLSVGLRWYISSHIPMSNGYETMIFISWCIMIVTILFGRKSEFIPSMGLLLSGFALLVATLGAMNPGITQLVPVLQSPWLSIHVSLIMISYSLFGFMMFNGITALILYFTSGKSRDYVVRLWKISRIISYPALFTLAAGIFVGAVWANVSWGRYWGWDPKEVWALITMLVYSFAMHDQSLKIFRKPIFYHLFTIVAFLSIIMTYFGVSYFFGGMHSYQ